MGPFLYNGHITLTRDFYQRLCTPVFDDYDDNYKKESLFSMFNRLQIEGMGLPLQRGGEFSIALAFPRLSLVFTMRRGFPDTSFRSGGGDLRGVRGGEIWYNVFSV